MPRAPRMGLPFPKNSRTSTAKHLLVAAMAECPYGDIWDIYFTTTWANLSPEQQGFQRDSIEAFLHAFEADPTILQHSGDFESSNVVSVDFALLVSHLKPVVGDQEADNLNGALEANPELVLSCIGVAVHIATLADAGPIAATQDHRVCPRLRNFSPITPMRSLKANSVGHFVAIRGTVIRVSNIKPVVVRMPFICSKCHQKCLARFSDGKYAPPVKCESVKCRSKTFIPLRDEAETMDWQRVRLQELTEATHDSGRVPRTIEVELTGDEVDTCVPGDIVTVAGIVKLISIDAGKPMNRVSKQNKKPIFYNYIDANCVENSKHLVSSASSSSGGDGNTNGSEDKSHISGNSKLESLQFSVKDLYGIQRIAQHPHCMALVCQSMCPTIYGHDLVKAGLALSLFGGKQNRMVDPKGRVSIRGDIHVLIVGDPGLGKSQLLQSVAHISPRGVYVCGSYASASGLTVAIHREAGSQDYILEAGALVLSDQGTCCIDEFDKMPKDWQALLEAMEQQQISIAKAGIVCNLPARSSLIAAANPVHGHYNKGKTVAENLKMNAPLLSRFDLIFILLDRPDQQRDKLISDHVMKLHDRDNYGSSGDPFTNSQHVIHDLEYGQTPAGLSLQDRLRALPPDSDPIPPSLLRKYISYAKRYAEPALTPEASQAIQEFYLQLRHNNANQDGGTPVTTRQLESLIRLAEARAKIELRTSVTRQDAEDVIELFKACLRDTEDSGDLPTLDLRGERPVNKSKARMAFIAALTTVAKQEDKSQFTYQEMYNVSKQINLRLPPPMQFSDLVESLNVDGFILKKKGGAEYKLTTTGP